MKVLLADDDAVLRLLVESMLRIAGNEVVSVADGAAAIEALGTDEFALVVLDWEMPQRSGIDVCRTLRDSDRNHDAYVLMLTSRDHSSDLLGALQAGVDDYVNKPITPDMFAARLAIAERRIDQDRRRREAEDAVARNRYLAGIGETTLAIQHEINNPLAALMAHAELLRMESPGGNASADERDHVDVILDSTRRIAAVVRRLVAAVQQPTTVEYVNGERMIDLSAGGDGQPGSGRGKR